jgi:glycerol-3-phosphate acyltransferase PlsX
VSPAPVRVAVDLLGGDAAPAVVADGAVRALADDPALAVALVGPDEITSAALASAGSLADRVDVVAADDVIGMADDPVRAVRSRRGASVRVAARLLHDSTADAMVTIGSTGAAVASAVFTVGRLPGMSRPALAVVVPAFEHPVALLDVGANTEASADVLAQFAVAGAAFGRLRLGTAQPRIGLLSIGAEAGKGDTLRRSAATAVAAALTDVAARYVGNVEGGDVALGGRADVVVTDGFTGNVLLKGIEGTYRLVTGSIHRAVGSAGDHDDGLVSALTAGHRPLRPERFGGGVLLGVGGVVVVGHGSSGAPAVTSCVRLAAETARSGMVAGIADGLSGLAARRRVAAAVPAATPAGS